MYRLNCLITEEAEQFIKTEAKRYGTSMGALITMWSLEKKKEMGILDVSHFIIGEKNKAENGK